MHHRSILLMAVPCNWRVRASGWKGRRGGGGRGRGRGKRGSTLRASRSRVHATRCPFFLLLVSSTTAREGENDIYPVMDASSVRRYLAPDANHAVDVTPTTRRDLARNSMYGVHMRIDVVRRDAFTCPRRNDDGAASSIEAFVRGKASVGQ